MAVGPQVVVPASKRGSQCWRDVALAYLHLTKPRIVALLLITTVPAMVLAEGGVPSLYLIAATLLGGALTAGGANAVNCYFDRDIDRLMNRTKRRPVPAGRVEPELAVLFGLLIGAAGVLVLDVLVNPLAAVLAAGANVFYVLVYTICLKRTTVQNIVIGGAAGAMPPVVGWAAVTGSVDVAALVLFGIIFVWTPPHFWALSLVYAADYRRAGVPMLPAARSAEETSLQILLYSVLLVPVSLLLYTIGAASVIYAAFAISLGLPFVILAQRLFVVPSNRNAMRVFKYSLYYLALLFLAIVVDTLIT